MKTIQYYYFLGSVCTAVMPAFGSSGLMDYRLGHYFKAAESLMTEPEKSSDAYFYLGKMRLYGYGLPKNNKLMLDAMLRAGEQGNLPAQQWLARYYLAQKQADIAYQWFKRAAQAQDVSAQLYCIGASLVGYGTRKNPDDARNLAIMAARAGSAEAQYVLAMDFLHARARSTQDMGMIWLKKSALNAYAPAEITLGQRLLQTARSESDTSEALSWLKKAADHKDPAAWFALAEAVYSLGDVKNGFTLLHQAADNGDVHAMVSLSQRLAEPNTPYYNVQQAYLWALKAAERSSSDAQQLLSQYYQKGFGVAPDLALAQTWKEKALKTLASEQQASKDLRKALSLWLSHDHSSDFSGTPYQLHGIAKNWANQNMQRPHQYNPAPAMHLLTRHDIYQPNFAVASPDSIQLTEYFNFIAPLLTGSRMTEWYYPRYPLNRDIQAILNSHSYVLGPRDWQLVADDIQMAPDAAEPSFGAEWLENMTADADYKINLQSILSWLYQRAILGEAEAQFQLGQLYEYGIVVAKNIPQAINYYELAALQQDVEAEYNLGVLYLQGKTNPVDYKKGLAWISDAAFKGNTHAQYALANLYHDGLTEPDGKVLLAPDHAEARAMFYIASAHQDGLSQFKLADDLAQDRDAALNIASQKKRIALIKRLYTGAQQHGIPEAILPKAFYDAMDPDINKQTEAFLVAQREFAAGNTLSALLLGMMYERGIGVAPDLAKAVYWYQQVPNNPLSAFVLGTWTMEGKAGLSLDQQVAGERLQYAADAGFAYAWYNLAIHHRAANMPFLPALEHAHALGNARAGLLLADYDMSIADKPESMARARSIYQSLAEKGDRDAQVKLGFLYEHGLGGQIDVNNAFAAYQEAARQNQPLGQFLLGQYYQSGLGASVPDYAQAQQWYEKSARVYAPSAVALGYVLETVADRYAEAKGWYEAAAQQGDRVGAYNLGLVYEAGKDEPVAYNAARVYYEKAAGLGYAAAMSRLGTFYFKGLGVDVAPEQARTWYEKAAHMDDREALYRLGEMYEKGIGLPQNITQSIQYYDKASALGYETAKLALARIYQYGTGVPQDLGRARDLYQEMAERDNALAQYHLGMLYMGNALGNPDVKRARDWLAKAAHNGNHAAKLVLGKLEKVN